MATTFKGTRIVSDFIKSINQMADLSATRTSISKQVFEINGLKNCLIYVKSRSDYPLKWGVTANVIHRLNDQRLPWFVILLFLSHETGYFLDSDDVDYYIRNVWPLGSDGDYKPAEGTYLNKNSPFSSVETCINQL